MMRPESSNDMGDPLEITCSRGTMDLDWGKGEKNQDFKMSFSLGTH